MRTCNSCGVVAGAASRFKGGLCLSCREAQRPDVEARTALSHVVLVVVAVVGLLVGRDTAWAPVVWVATVLAGVDAAALCMVIVHEAAHAVTATLLGSRVREVHIGIGPEVLALGSTPRIHLRLIPLGGLTRHEGADLGRLGYATILLAGPLAHVPAAALAWAILPVDPLWGPSRLTVVAYLLFQAVFNLLPFVDHDGRHLLDLARMQPGEVPALTRSHEAAVALQTAQRAGTAPDLALRDTFLDAVQVPSSPDKRALDLNNLAFTNLLIGDEGLVDEAVVTAREAVALFPDHAGIRNTLGLALIAAGDDEGIPLVTSTLSYGDADEVGICHSMLALGHARRGNAHAARRHVAWLRAHGHDDRWSRQAVHLLGPLEARVVQGFLDTSDSPEEAAASLLREAGPIAAVIGDVLLHHLQETAGNDDLNAAAHALCDQSR